MTLPYRLGSVGFSLGLLGQGTSSGGEGKTSRRQPSIYDVNLFPVASLLVCAPLCVSSLLLTSLFFFPFSIWILPVSFWFFSGHALRPVGS